MADLREVITYTGSMGIVTMTRDIEAREFNTDIWFVNQRMVSQIDPATRRATLLNNKAEYEAKIVTLDQELANLAQAEADAGVLGRK